ncbi:MAG: hypothetical protein IJM44_03590 [Ruminococcus sp.]|nr:hypothetical protein [Ruminococcus sp.]
MGKRPEIKVVSYVMLDGEPHKFDELDDKTRASCVRKMLDNMSRTLSDYYSNHLDEAEQLAKQPFARVLE